MPNYVHIKITAQRGGGKTRVMDAISKFLRGQGAATLNCDSADSEASGYSFPPYATSGPLDDLTIFVETANDETDD
jgi:hypothetical protein